MEGFYQVLSILTGLIVRLGIPIIGTVVLIALLRRLDAHWQEDAIQSVTRHPVAQPRNTRCWETHGCPEEQKLKCPAYAHQEMPCWQVFRSKNGILRQGCIDCQVFQAAPIPVISGD